MPYIFPITNEEKVLRGKSASIWNMLSAMELPSTVSKWFMQKNPSEDSEGILLESVLEGYAEYFLADLAEKLRAA